MSFETIHSDICNVLEKDAFLLKNNVQVFQEDKGDVIATVKGAIMKLGICAVVAVPSAKAVSENSRNIVAMAEVMVQVVESPALNRGRANSCSAGIAARHIAAVLNLEKTKEGNCIVFRDLSGAVLEGGNVAYNVWFKVQTTLSKNA